MKALGQAVRLAVVVAAVFCISAADAKVKQGTITVKVDLKTPAEANTVRLWIPYPMSDADQDITAITFSGNYSSAGVYKDPLSESGVLYAEWRGAAEKRILTYTFHATRRDVKHAALPKHDMPLSRREFAHYLDNAWLGPTEEKVRAEAVRIVKGRKTTLAKARAIYDWVVDMMRRDPNAKACGMCDVERLLAEKMGKCADVHTVFVALCRAAGIPARDIWGIRMPKTAEGEMTKMQHCWAEFYLPGYGWVPVDAADVHKIIHDRKLGPDDVKRLPERDVFFGGLDEYRIQLGSAHGRLNPPQAGQPLVYFMYPYAEADGRPLGEDINHNFGYTISFRE